MDRIGNCVCVVYNFAGADTQNVELLQVSEALETSEQCICQ